jgi:hypothetical protein
MLVGFHLDGFQASAIIQKIMTPQIFSAILAEADVQATKAAIGLIREQLPVLANLATQERQTIFRTAANRLCFVQNALRAAQNYPDRAPQRLVLPEFDSHIDLIMVLTDLIVGVEQLIWKLENPDLAAARDGAAVAQTPGPKSSCRRFFNRDPGRRRAWVGPTSRF